jgi:excisionase family DNA binding protein
MSGSTVDIHDAAEILKCHYKTVLDLIEKGALPAAKVGKAWVMLTVDVHRHLENEIIRQTAARMRQPRVVRKYTRKATDNSATATA